MRLVYCPSCQHVNIRGRFERAVCERCRRPARQVRVPYPWQSFVGSAVVSAGAVFLVLPQVAAGIPWSAFTDTLTLRLVWLVVFVGLGLYFSSWGLRIMRAIALERGRALFPEAPT